MRSRVSMSSGGNLTGTGDQADAGNPVHCETVMRVSKTNKPTFTAQIEILLDARRFSQKAKSVITGFGSPLASAAAVILARVW